MKIRRPTDPERDFVKVRNAWARDPRLSRRARGLLAELLSHRDGWETSIEDLVRKGPEGRDAIHTALRELREVGYLRLEQGRRERARLGSVEYVLTAPPTAFQEADDQEAVDPEAENPRAKKTTSQKTNREKTTPQNEPAPPLGRGRRRGRRYLATLLWTLDQLGAVPPELAHLDFEALPHVSIAQEDVDVAIRSALRELYHQGQDPEQLGEAFPELHALWQSGAWPRRDSGVLS